MSTLMTVLFAIAVSADGFMAGITYGIRKIRIPVVSLAIIAATSAFAISISMIIGQGISTYLTAQAASQIGALIMIALGIYFFILSIKNKVKTIESEVNKPLYSISIKPIGVIIQILKEPVAADFDASGEINVREALFLGMALAMDAMGAGIGFALTGSSVIMAAIWVGFIKFVVLRSGIFIGYRIQEKCNQNVIMALPGLIFVAIGLIELF